MQNIYMYICNKLLLLIAAIL